MVKSLNIFFNVFLQMIRTVKSGHVVVPSLAPGSLEWGAVNPAATFLAPGRTGSLAAQLFHTPHKHSEDTLAVVEDPLPPRLETHFACKHSRQPGSTRIWDVGDRRIGRDTDGF